jgi:hypothetical protein
MNARRLTRPVAQLMEAFTTYTTFRPGTRAVAV